MKTIHKLLTILLLATICSCSSPFNSISSYQHKNLKKFNKSKNYVRVNKSHYRPLRKTGSYNHPAVTADSRRSMRIKKWMKK